MQGPLQHWNYTRVNGGAVAKPQVTDRFAKNLRARSGREPLSSGAGVPNGADAMELEELSTVLWQERQLLELLLFKLESEQLLLAAGATRWLGHATHEVEVVLEQLRSFEVLRAAGVQDIGRRLGFGDEPPRLAQLSESAPSPWDGIFREHRAAFLALTNEINATAAANRDLLMRAQKATESTLAWLVDAEPEVYSGRGAARSGGPTRHLFDEVM